MIVLQEHGEGILFRLEGESKQTYKWNWLVNKLKRVESVLEISYDGEKRLGSFLALELWRPLVPG